MLGVLLGVGVIFILDAWVKKRFGVRWAHCDWMLWMLHHGKKGHQSITVASHLRQKHIKSASEEFKFRTLRTMHFNPYQLKSPIRSFSLKMHWESISDALTMLQGTFSDVKTQCKNYSWPSSSFPIFKCKHQKRNKYGQKLHNSTPEN